MTIEEILEPGKIGYYASCEVEVIFLRDMQSGNYINLFSLFCFKIDDISATNPQYVSFDKVSKRFGLRHIRYGITINQAINDFYRLLNDNIFRPNESALEISDNIEFIVHGFIPAKNNFYPEIRLNNVLNGDGSFSSYAFEFADIDKSRLTMLLSDDERQELDQIFQELENKLELKLRNAPERLGNIVFQIPINIVKFYRDSQCNLTVVWNDNLTEPVSSKLLFFNESDSLFDSLVVQDLQGNQVVFQEREEARRVILKKVDDNLNIAISHNCRVFNAGIGSKVAFIKTTRNFDGNTENFALLSISRREIPMSFNDVIEKAIDYRKKLDLEEGLVFKQYGNVNSSINESLDDIRTLINKYGENGVYLWDPYISAEEILQTIYYHNFFSPKRVITSAKAYRPIYGCQETSYEVDQNQSRKDAWISDNRRRLDQVAGEYGWKLEFRGKFGQYGWSFHDRFILFPNNGKPRVWSLGKSISHVADDHHILQEVLFPERVIDAFNELWQELGNEECKIYPYK